MCYIKDQGKPQDGFNPPYCAKRTLKFVFDSIPTCCHNQGVWTKHDKNCHNWYGWSPKGSLTEGSITTTFSGSGRARLDFGNCNFKGIVKAFLDGQEIASAIPKSALIPHKFVDFNFHPGSKLTIREDETGVIQFNSLAVIGCGEDFLSTNQKSVKSF